MLARILLSMTALTCACANSAYAGDAASGKTLDVKIEGISDGKPIPVVNAFCAPGNKDGGNNSPAISWGKGPYGTQSFAIIMYDEDVPQDFSTANKKDMVVAKDAPRKDFYHWVLVDIPADTTSLPVSGDSDSVVKAGKPIGKRSYGVRGKNDFGSFMQGTFGGYDGPCPPWNDEAVHHYHFDVYALDVPSLNLTGEFGGEEAKKAIEGHILAKGGVIGTYTLNPAVNLK